MTRVFEFWNGNLHMFDWDFHSYRIALLVWIRIDTHGFKILVKKT